MYEKNSLNLMLALLISLILSLGTIGCNTMRGMGQDIESLGETIERQASQSGQK